MSLLEEYVDARRVEELAHLRRVMALRAMVAAGMTQRSIAADLGVTQPAVSQQLRAGRELAVPVGMLVEAAAPVLRHLADQRAFSRLAVFGSVARGTAGEDSDVDLVVQPPFGASIRDLVELQELFERVLGRPVDLVSYGGLRAGLDDDIRREAVLL